MKVSQLLPLRLCWRKADCQYVEFSGGDFNDNEDDVHLPDPNADVANAKLNKSLENLLVSKNRRLLEDLTKLRVSWDELSTTHESSAQTIDQLQNELDTIKQLNERLENDLMSLNKEGEMRDREAGAGLAGLDIGKPVGRQLTRVLQDIADTVGWACFTSNRGERRYINPTNCYFPA
jgi:homeobox protein cut-like